MGSEFGIFGGFGWVRSSVLVGVLGFGRVRISTSRVRSSSEFVTFGFDPSLIHIENYLDVIIGELKFVCNVHFLPEDVAFILHFWTKCLLGRHELQFF